MASAKSAYSAKDIEVLEGLEPVRRRPGMYIGGTDEAALHHLAAEMLDNAMDEAVAGHASFIEVTLEPGNWLTVRDNGRGIPVDPHPKFKNLSALEVILTTLHSGGKFGGKVYATSGGLHGVGSSVVNALSDGMEVEVARDRILWKQGYARGKPTTKLVNAGPVQNRRGTSIRFKPDPQCLAPSRSARRGYIGCAAPRPICSAACRSAGPAIRRCCEGGKDDTPAEAVLHFPGGLRDSLEADIGETPRVLPQPWAGEADLPGGGGRVEWAAAWLEEGEGFVHSYCNTIPTTLGGTHEAGFRAALLKGPARLGRASRQPPRRPGHARGPARPARRQAVGVPARAAIPGPDQGKADQHRSDPAGGDRAARPLRPLARRRSGAGGQSAGLRHRARGGAAAPAREQGHRPQVRHAAAAPARQADRLHAGERRRDRDLPGRGRFAGGSAKQARNRETQAVLPLRGKILNVASASADKLRQNQELKDLIEALGCGVGDRFDRAKLRYGRIIIMTDADVDGAHIASLLMTFFYRELPELVRHGHVYLAQPPLYRLTQGAKSVYAMDDADREARRNASSRPTQRWRSAASRGWARCRRRSSRRPPWTRPSARC